MTRAFSLALAALLLVASPALGIPDDAVPIHRFQRVDERLYRGAQPDRAGLEYLKKLGVRTVLNLRDDEYARSGDERRIVESLGMRYVHLPVRDGNFFRRSRTIPVETIRSFFAVVDAAENGPVFVHCRRGADRTGALVGFYRIARHGWDGARAYAEAQGLGIRSWYTGLRQQIYGFKPDGSERSPLSADRKSPI